MADAGDEKLFDSVKDVYTGLVMFIKGMCGVLKWFLLILVDGLRWMSNKKTKSKEVSK